MQPTEEGPKRTLVLDHALGQTVQHDQVHHDMEKYRDEKSRPIPLSAFKPSSPTPSRTPLPPGPRRTTEVLLTPTVLPYPYEDPPEASLEDIQARLIKLQKTIDSGKHMWPCGFTVRDGLSETNQELMIEEIAKKLVPKMFNKRAERLAVVTASMLTLILAKLYIPVLIALLTPVIVRAVGPYLGAQLALGLAGVVGVVLLGWLGIKLFSRFEIRKK